ncbi:shikimate dehydrogenase [Lacibacter luteus]|uniref:Shikimate dehydrogenase n=1 Tax=Lacibacter luteus TaxID=2508719 RepID=A0A4Q1CG72_9BACT|nr:shikimate dehydrogenase [Lacibacter luteus]RXK58755.1 shikimate dehydrogenase [Lacibacter luteus]
MRQFGLIGYPLSHSFSKKYFTEKFAAENISGCNYELYSIESIDLLPSVLKQVDGLEGMNVTIPYKESVLPFLHEQSTAVQEIGACNCIRIRNGKLTGFNTDVVGFRQSIEPLLKSQHQNALVLGTGGAAKAVVWVLKQLGINYSYVSRTKSEGVLGYDEITGELLQKYPLVINTTPLGMQPNVHAKPSLPYESVTADFLFYDLVYNPAKTAFLETAEQYGATIKNGADMLVIQAEESWQIWNS